MKSRVNPQHNKIILLHQFIKVQLGETPFLERAKSTLRVGGPSQKCGRAIRATLVASCYPSRAANKQEV